MSSRKELIQQYEEGKLSDSAVYPLTNSSALVIVEIFFGIDIDGKVFGYFSNGESKDFFLRKLIDNQFFKIGNTKYNLDDFCRVYKRSFS